jgi:hypothetical protein
MKQRFLASARITMTLLLSTVLSGFLPATVAFASANNGTLQVHEKDSTVLDPSNEPKVCIFNFEAFGLDAGQTGDVTIATQGGGVTALTVSLTTDQGGDGSTEYINDANTALSLADGHYKATLDNKFGTDTDDKAKSKVFKVECTVPPTDVCPNVTGVQSTDTECDVCPNVTGVQSTDTECDVCPNVTGVQSTDTECDVCPYVSGTQSVISECNVCPTGSTNYEQVHVQRSEFHKNKKCKVTPAVPTQTPPTCVKLGTYTIPSTTGVKYLVNGNVKAAGTYEAQNGTSVTITAQAEAGFKLKGATNWTFNFTAPTNCQQVPVGGMGGGQVLGTSTVKPAVAVINVSSFPVGGQGAGTLANTGEDSNPFVNILIGFALVAMALGTTTLVRKQN